MKPLRDKGIIRASCRPMQKWCKRPFPEGPRKRSSKGDQGTGLQEFPAQAAFHGFGRFGRFFNILLNTPLHNEKHIREAARQILLGFRTLRTLPTLSLNTR